MELVPKAEFSIVTRASKAWIPELIAAAGPEVTETYIDFFTATIRNRNTRQAYARACWQFFDWCAAHGLQLTTVRPFHVAAWIEDFPGSKPTIKQKLAAVRMLYDTIIQVCYWLDQYWFATLRLGYNPFLGHLILFLSRLNFIFAPAVFSAVYLVRFNELDISFWGLLILSIVLFSIFCYTLELERIGRALVKRKDRSCIPENSLKCV